VPDLEDVKPPPAIGDPPELTAPAMMRRLSALPGASS